MKMKQQTIDALEGYVAMGNYTDEQYEAIVNSTENFLTEAIDEIAARHAG